MMIANCDGVCVRVFAARCEHSGGDDDVMTGEFSFSESDDDDYDDVGMIQLDDTAHNERRDVPPHPTSTSWPRPASRQVPAAASGAAWRPSTLLLLHFCCSCFVFVVLADFSADFSAVRCDSLTTVNEKTTVHSYRPANPRRQRNS